MESRSERPRGAGQQADVTKWMVGCAVGGAAIIGISILVFLVALALQPPTWIQVVIGVGLAAGASIFTWLVASAWRGSGRDDRTPR